MDIDYRAVREKGAVLYRCFLEKAENWGKGPGRPRKPGAGYRRAVVSLT
jgi:hypothetical protein